MSAGSDNIGDIYGGIARFGHGLAQWLTVTARFVTGDADQPPFPWTICTESRAE